MQAERLIMQGVSGVQIPRSSPAPGDMCGGEEEYLSRERR